MCAQDVANLEVLLSMSVYLLPPHLTTVFQQHRASLSSLCGPLSEICKLSEPCIPTSNQQQLTPASLGKTETQRCFFSPQALSAARFPRGWRTIERDQLTQGEWTPDIAAAAGSERARR